MSVRLNGTADQLIATQGVSIGTQAYTIATMFKRMSDLNAVSDLFYLGVDAAGTYPNIGLYFSADGTSLVGTYGSDSTIGSYATTQDIWYWGVFSRAGTGAGAARLRVFGMDGTKLHETTGTDGNTYNSMDTIIYGESGQGNNTMDGEVCNGKIHTGVEWSDEQCVVEMRHFDNQVLAGNDRIAFRLEDTTNTYAGLKAIPKAGQSAITLTNTGVVDGASRPSALEPLGIYLRQFFHNPESDLGNTIVTGSFPANVAAGNLIDVVVGHNGVGTTTTGVADLLSNTYTEIADCAKLDTPDTQWQRVFYAKNITGGTCGVTASFSTTALWRSLLLTEWGGLNTTSPLDHSVGGNTAVTTFGSSSVPTTAGQLVVISAKDSSVSNMGTVSTNVSGTLHIGPLGLSAATSATDLWSGYYIRRVAHTLAFSANIPASRTILLAQRTYKPAVLYGKSDNFDRTEDPLSDGGKWSTTGILGWLKTGGDSAIGASASFDNMMYRNDTGAGNDQWVAGILGSGNDAGVMLRVDASGNAMGVHPYGSGEWMFFTNSAYSGGPSLPNVAVYDDEIYAEVVGTSRIAAVWYNGVFQMAVTLSSGPTSGGAPGIFAYSNTSGQAEWRSWAGGGLWDAPSSGIAIPATRPFIIRGMFL